MLQGDHRLEFKIKDVVAGRGRAVVVLAVITIFITSSDERTTHGGMPLSCSERLVCSYASGWLGLFRCTAANVIIDHILHYVNCC